MRRSDREQSLEFSLALIDRCQHGTVAFATEDGAPYCIPLSLVRVGDKLYFHCAKEGHKTDLLRHDSRVCITFVGADEPAFVAPAMYTTYFQSAVVIGRASEVTEPEEKAEALRALADLKGCQAHCSVILSPADEITYRKLGLQLTCEPQYQTNKLYHR